jgi:hypothetical protein
MTKREAMRQTHQENTLLELGFTRDEAAQLRRISMALQRWFELECGTGEGQTIISVERDGENGDGKPFKRIQYPSARGYVDRRYPIPDRETGARKRLQAIIKARNERTLITPSGRIITETDKSGAVSAFIQTDPRGAALYILRPGDVPEGADVSAYYTRGIVVY